jgi:hypothetical protein
MNEPAAPLNQGWKLRLESPRREWEATSETRDVPRVTSAN